MLAVSFEDTSICRTGTTRRSKYLIKLAPALPERSKWLRKFAKPLDMAARALDMLIGPSLVLPRALEMAAAREYRSAARALDMAASLVHGYAQDHTNL